MKSGATIVGLLIALGVGYFVYMKSLTSAGGTEAPPQQTIDVTDIRSNLMTIGQAERIYVTNHGTYGTIEQLNQDGPPMLPSENRGYVFSATPNGATSFKVTPLPTDPNKPGWPMRVVTEAMTVTDGK